MTDRIEARLRHWREATESLAAPAGLVEQIQRQLHGRGARRDEVDSAFEALEAKVEEACWYLGVDERRLGPLTPGRIRELWGAGEIGPDTLCWKPSFDEWKPLSRVPELAALVAAPRRDEHPSRALSLLADLAREDIAALSAPKAALPPQEPLPEPEPRSVEVAVPPPSVIRWSQLPGFLKASLAVGGVALVALVGLVGWLVLRDASPKSAPAPVAAAAAGSTRTAGRPVGTSSATSTGPAAVSADNASEREMAAASATAPGARTGPSSEPAASRTEGSAASGSAGAAAQQNSGASPMLAMKSPAGPSRKSAPNAATTNERPVKLASAEPVGDDFDKEFGGGVTSSKSSAPAANPMKPGVYIPPAPGSASATIPDQLGTSDIMQVVLSQKPALARCMEEHKKREPGVSGKLVMRWTILPSGRTANVTCQSDEFKSTYMAACVTGLIKGWSFPRHKVQGDPVEFPFKF